MKMKLWAIAVILALVIPARAATNDLTSLLQKGLFEEEANRNLDAAITNYQSLAAQFDKDRKVAATAVFRLGECYRKLGKTNEAAAQYQRIVREFSDQPTLVTLSRQNLAGMDVAQSSGALPDDQMMQAATAAQNEADLLKSQLNQLKSLPPQQLRTVVQQSYSNPVLTKLFEDLADAEQKLVTLGVNLTSDSPTYRGQQNIIDTINKQIDQQINGVLLGLSIKQKAAEEQAKALRAQAGNSNEIAIEAANLDAKLATLEKSDGDAEKHARSVASLFPDELLQRMLQRLPLLQAQETKFKADPNEKLDHFSVAVGENSSLLEDLTKSFTPELAAAETQKQLTLIKQRVAEILANQNTRLKTLREIAGSSFNNFNSGYAAEPAPVTDEEEKEIRRIQAMIQNSPDLINSPNGPHPLVKAAAAGWLKVAAFLLDHGADINVPDNFGKSALYVAAEAGNKAMTELLLNRGANVNVKNNLGTPLHIAAERGFRSVAEVLLNHGADVNAKSKNGSTPLSNAVSVGNLGTVQILLAAKADPNLSDVSGGTPLGEAAQRGEMEIAKALLAAKANVNAHDNIGETPLFLAAKFGKGDVAEMLLEAGAQANLELTGGKYNWSPLDFAVAAGNESLTRKLLERGADPNHVASRRPVNTANNDGGAISSPGPVLMTACEKNNPALVKILLEHGADPNVRYSGQRPLLFNVIGKPEVLKLLLENKANPNLEDTMGYTALHYATTNSIPLLVNHGANVNAQNKYGSTPLSRAVMDARSDAVSEFLASKADPNIRDQDGNTALHWAVYQSNKDMVSELLAHKANPNVRNKMGNTPLDLAKQGMKGQIDVGQLETSVGQGHIKNVDASEMTEIANILRKHGALDQLPEFSVIRVTRPGFSEPAVVFHQNTNGWNHFTLLETLQSSHLAEQPLGADWIFPDLTRLIIHRPSREAGGKEQQIKVNLLNATNGVDCSKDIPLQFGDVVEIPVREHTLNEPPIGLSAEQEQTMIHFLKRHVRIKVRDQTRDLTLITRDIRYYFFLGGALRTPDAQSLLLSSSDLSRVKVTRKDPATGKTTEFIVDVPKVRNTPQDLFLRDGDVIEVPEK